MPPIQPPFLQEPSRTPLQNHLGGGMLKGLFWSRREPQKSIINTEDFEIQAQGACKPGQQFFKVREGVGRPQIGEATMVMMLTPCPGIISIIGNAPPMPLSTHQQPLDNSLFGGRGGEGWTARRLSPLDSLCRGGLAIADKLVMRTCFTISADNRVSSLGAFPTCSARSETSKISCSPLKRLRVTRVTSERICVFGSTLKTSNAFKRSDGSPDPESRTGSVPASSCRGEEVFARIPVCMARVHGSLPVASCPPL